MYRRGDDWRGGARRPGLFRRMRAVLWPRRSFGIGESLGALRRDFEGWRTARPRDASRVRLDETGAFDLDATAFLHGQRRRAFEEALAARQGATARSARIFLTLGVLFFLAWLYRLLTMRWTTSATLTALQFTPACLVFFLLAFRFALENYQIRMRRKVTVMEYLTASRSFWPR